MVSPSVDFIDVVRLRLHWCLNRCHQTLTINCRLCTPIQQTLCLCIICCSVHIQHKRFCKVTSIQMVRIGTQEQCFVQSGGFIGLLQGWLFLRLQVTMACWKFTSFKSVFQLDWLWEQWQCVVCTFFKELTLQARHRCHLLCVCFNQLFDRGMSREKLMQFWSSSTGSTCEYFGSDLYKLCSFPLCIQVIRLWLSLPMFSQPIVQTLTIKQKKSCANWFFFGWNVHPNLLQIVRTKGVKHQMNFKCDPD